MVGLIGAGAFVAFGERLRGAAARAPPARRLVGAQRAGHDARRRAQSGGAVRLGDPVRVGWARIDAPRGRVDLYPAGRLRTDGQEGQAQDRTGRRRHQPPGVVPVTTCSIGSRPASCSPAPRSSRCARAGAQLKDGYAAVDDGEVWLHNVHIPPYGPAARENHDPERARKLLLHRREIDRLLGQTAERGLTLVPTRIYFSGPQRQGRDRAGARQGPVRQARVDPRARDQARHANAPCATAQALARRSTRARLVERSCGLPRGRGCALSGPSRSPARRSARCRRRPRAARLTGLTLVVGRLLARAPACAASSAARSRARRRPGSGS